MRGGGWQGTESVPHVKRSVGIQWRARQLRVDGRRQINMAVIHVDVREMQKEGRKKQARSYKQ